MAEGKGGGFGSSHFAFSSNKLYAEDGAVAYPDQCTRDYLQVVIELIQLLEHSLHDIVTAALMSQKWPCCFQCGFSLCLRNCTSILFASPALLMAIHAEGTSTALAAQRSHPALIFHLRLATAFTAASSRSSAVVMVRPLFWMISFPRSTLVPSSRTINGTLMPTSLAALTMPLAMTSHFIMPPARTARLLRHCRTFQRKMLIAHRYGVFAEQHANKCETMFLVTCAAHSFRARTQSQCLEYEQLATLCQA